MHFLLIGIQISSVFSAPVESSSSPNVKDLYTFPLGSKENPFIVGVSTPVKSSRNFDQLPVVRPSSATENSSRESTPVKTAVTPIAPPPIPSKKQSTSVINQIANVTQTLTGALIGAGVTAFGTVPIIVAEKFSHQSTKEQGSKKIYELNKENQELTKKAGANYALGIQDVSRSKTFDYKKVEEFLSAKSNELESSIKTSGRVNIDKAKLAYEGFKDQVIANSPRLLYE